MSNRIVEFGGTPAPEVLAGHAIAVLNGYEAEYTHVDRTDMHVVDDLRKMIDLWLQSPRSLYVAESPLLEVAQGTVDNPYGTILKAQVALGNKFLDDTKPVFVLRAQTPFYHPVNEIILGDELTKENPDQELIDQMFLPVRGEMQQVPPYGSEELRVDVALRDRRLPNNAGRNPSGFLSDLVNAQIVFNPVTLATEAWVHSGRHIGEVAHSLDSGITDGVSPRLVFPLLRDSVLQEANKPNPIFSGKPISL